MQGFMQYKKQLGRYAFVPSHLDLGSKVSEMLLY